ncbi:hypothetical protein SAY87_019027 [Trapa incisa]|uniref:DUF4378 domain-containing protein n=1 Tax=Trapa incisa TaxID=236973 RepID=A0AAN7Q1A2_9MYRT|nr:hypothetical protein SAY87_019027 [Trapa incisa]
MRQDGRKSVGYKPFFTCYDPGDVVECGTIRKSDKSNYRKMEPSSGGRHRPVSLNKAVSYRDELSESSLKLLGVSKGDHNLSCVIELWSNGMNVEGQPSNMEEDLFEEAIDLQESFMLEKLKLASRYMARLKPKKDESVVLGLPVGMSHCQDIEFQLGEASPGDESSRKKIKETGEVFTDCLVMQNQLDKRIFEPHLEIPSASSSQFSSVDSEGGNNAAMAKKASNRNIIAKLRGLEVIFSKPVQWKLQDKKILQQQKKHEYNEPYQGILKGMLGKKQFKGFLNSSIREALVVDADDVPPIVLIRPSSKSCHSSNETLLKGPKMNRKFMCRTVDREVVSDAEAPQKSQRASNKSRHASPPIKKHFQREKHGNISVEAERLKKGSKKSPEKAISKAKITQKSVDRVESDGPAMMKPDNRASCVGRKPSPQWTLNCRQHHTKKESSTLEVQRRKKTASSEQTRTLSKICASRRTIPTGNQPAAKMDKNDSVQEKASIKIYNAVQNKIVRLKMDIGKEDQHFSSWNHKAYEVGVGDIEKFSDMESSLDVISPSTSESGAGVDCQNINTESFEAGDHTKLLLLSSPFLSRAQGGSAFVSAFPSLSQKPTANADSISHTEKLSVDSVDEFMGCKTGDALVHSSLIADMGSLRSQISTNYLGDEILEGLENHSSYCRIESETLLMNHLDPQLRRAAKSRLWGEGWTKGFCFEHVVKETEENILSILVEEAVDELVQ